MIEQYTIIKRSNASDYRCPYPFIDNHGHSRAYCEGANCMAWIKELDDYGNPTGRGRCGMVASSIFLPMTYSCECGEK